MKITSSQIKKVKNYFTNQTDILAVYLYGSFAKKMAHKKSDLDIAILFSRPVNLYRRLGQIYSDLCDLGLPAEPEVREVDLNSPPVYLFNVINSQLIFSRNDIKRINFEVQTLKQYYDTQRLRDIKHHYMNRRFQKGTYGY